MNNKQSTENRSEISELLRFWYIPISAFFYLFMYIQGNVGGFLSLCISLFLWFVVIKLNKTEIITVVDKKRRKSELLFAVMTAAGICMQGQDYSYQCWVISPKIEALYKYIPRQIDIALVMSITSAVFAFVFVFFFVIFFWHYFMEMSRKLGIFDNVSKNEIGLYIGVVLLLFVLLGVISSRTNVFYGTENEMDLIYVSDSSFLLKPSAFFTIMHHENDIRQPLFAVFSAPIFGLSYLIGRLFCMYTIHIYLYNCIHVVMIFLANYLLAKSLKFREAERVIFVFGISAMYCVMLYLMLMEQYPVAYFYLILLFCAECAGKQSSFLLYGAGGTLLTSLSLILFDCDVKNQKTDSGALKRRLLEIVKRGGGFLVICLLFGRFDLIYGIKTNIILLKAFTGYKISFFQRLKQYVYFVQSCFFAPRAGVTFRGDDNSVAAWSVYGGKYYAPGIIILVIVMISMILNREKISCRIASFWVAASFVILCLCGWGTVENGLVLYCLYFGWCFFVLIVLFVQWIGEKVKMRTLSAFTLSAFMIVMLIYNIPQIMKMLEFGMQYYPIQR